jgi:hypothetical protein
MRAPLSVVALVLAAGTAVVWESTMTYSEPLFFDCHGTFTSATTGTFDDKWPMMIDPDRGVVDGIGGGTNKYCTKESDWMPCEGGGAYKIIRDCTALHISETYYTFRTITEGRNKSCQDSSGHSRPAGKTLGEGVLNRITGEISVQGVFHNEGESDFTAVWKGTCVRSQQKF